MTQEPIPMRLPCPACGELHIDGLAEDGTDWSKKPHATHACQFCGAVWRPAVVMTVGVRFLPGFRNAVAPEPPREPRAMTREEGDHTGLVAPAPDLLARCCAAFLAREGRIEFERSDFSLGAGNGPRTFEVRDRDTGKVRHVFRAKSADVLVAKIAAGECEP